MPRTILRCLWLAATAAGTAAVGAGYSGPDAVAIGMMAGGMAGNLSTEVFKILDHSVAGRFFDGHSGIDENHHVSIALRLAHLNALRTVFDRFDHLMKNELDEELRHSAERFSHGLDNFLTVDTKAAERGDLTGGPIRTSDENLIRQAVLRDLPKAFDQGLATRRAAGDHPAILKSLKQIREAAEAAVVAEICLRTSVLPENVPRLFQSAFDGSRFSDGWFDLFIRDAAFRLKDSADFERIWNAEQVALIKAITDAHTAVLAEINASTERIEQDQRTHIARTEQGQTEQKEMLQELLTIARGGGVFQRAAEQGISEAAVRAIVERLGGEKIGHDDLLPWLDNWIEAARQQLGRHGNEGAAFEAARREADRRFKAGHLREASSAFMDELAREERLETYRQTERKHVRIKLLEEAISFDELALDGDAAVVKLRMIAAIEGMADPDALGAWLHHQAASFCERGDQKGINAALIVGVTVYRAALNEYTRDRVPLNWATTQNNLGNALQTLGARESGAARLEEAVAAYRAALEEWTRDRVPLNWATTQNNLGTALRTLGERESGTARLEEALLAHESALDVYESARAAHYIAVCRANLNRTLALLSQKKNEV